ncbi:MAG: hypothetical protein Ct9H300mP6_15850 [Gammaproteobacteria bacterium]|nr:MAG: hypothetical protein Ct9H300mP6_15850 [Gammaproteobacteria bacterium]
MSRSSGAAVRHMSDDPMLGELLVMNYRSGELSERHRAKLDFTWKLSESPEKITEEEEKH